MGKRTIKFRAWHKDIGMQQDVCHKHSCDALMQCTGLKDKNGKDIYEGDMLETYVSCEGEYRNFEVRHGYRFDILLDPYEEGDALLSGFYLRGVEDIGWLGISRLSQQDEFEIVGNIYENPELLTNQ